MKSVAAVILLACFAGTAAAQTGGSIAGLVARYGWGPTAAIDDAFGIGLELEVLRLNRIVPIARIDHWDFGFSCVEFVPCPHGVTTYAAGMKLRMSSETGAVPYAGGDIGLMEWTSGANGMSLRLRAGLDVRLIRHIDLNVDGSHTRFLKRAGSGRIHDNGLTGISAGLRLWL